MKLTQDQNKAVQAIVQFCKDGKNLFTMGGYAGTGKTTTIAAAIRAVRSIEKFQKIKIAYCCFTGKAATVLKEKLQAAQMITDSDYCGTIHGLIYRPQRDSKGRRIWVRVFKLDYDLIVIDEASMVGDIIFNDLQSYGVSILAVGDHGQLPPVVSRYNLMEEPMIRLEQIHRQAEGNKIIHFSMLARKGEKIPFGQYFGDHGESFIKTESPVGHLIANDAEKIKNKMLLCAMNRTRVDINKNIRAYLDLPTLLAEGEKVICLRNNRTEGIFNGMVGEVIKINKTENEDFINVQIKFDLMGLEWLGDIFAHQFNQEKTLKYYKNYQLRKEYKEFDMQNLFDFGYAITVHKSQGSQSEQVILVDERMRSMSDSDYARWLYTGITRSSRDIVVCQP